MPVAWITDSTIEFEEIDKDFLECIPNIKKALVDMYPSCAFHGGKIKYKKVVENKLSNQKNYSMFYSGGVDSQSTLLSVKSNKPKLITIWGSDVWLPDEEGWKIASNSVIEASEFFNLDYMFIKSNFRNVINELALNDDFQELLQDNWWHGVEHGLALLGHTAPYVYSYKIKTHYIPATLSIHEKATHCASYPTIDESLKFCGCNIVHEGFEKNRQEKLTQICSYFKNVDDKVRIRACYMERGSKINCCICEKCYRTIMGIIVEGQNPSDYGFDISDRKIKQIKNKLKHDRKNLNINYYSTIAWNEIKNRAIENKQLIKNKRCYKWILKFDVDKYLSKEC